VKTNSVIKRPDLEVSGP